MFYTIIYFNNDNPVNILHIKPFFGLICLSTSNLHIAM